MADLNSTIVRGNLRVTEDTQVSGSISEGGTLLSDKYQAKLSSQTAYSAKGSATKVPQITTNSLGQVTGITEVTITDNDHNQTVKGNGTAFGANDAIDIVPGSNITITPDTTNKKITIAASQPTVNNGTLTIQKNGTTVATFTANQAGNSTANITVPTTLDDISDGSTRKLANYLPLAGGEMTGNISYKGTKSTSSIIKFKDNTSDAYGNGIAIGGGGIVIIGAGESSDLNYGSAGDESLYLAADSGIHFYSNAGGTTLANKYQAKLPTTTTAGKVLKSTSTAGTVEWGDDANTWRNVKVGTTEVLGTGTGTGALTFLSQNTNNGDITFTYDGGIKATAKVPSVGNGTLTIQGNGTAATTFTANQSGNSTLNIKGGGRTTVTKSADGEITISSTGDGNDNQTVKGNGTAFGANDAVNIIPGSNITVTANTTNKTITIAGTANDNQTVKGNGTAFGANDAIDIVGAGTVTVTADTTNKKITITGSAHTTDHNQTVKGNGTAFGADDAVNFVGTSPVSVTADTTNKKVTIAVSEATTSAAGLMSSSDKTKLNGIASGAEVNVQSDWNVTDTNSDAFIKNKPSIPTNFSDLNNRNQALVEWGGPSLSGDVSPLEVATIDDLGHNKFAFLSAASVVVEYSRDAGATWVDYGATDAERRQLVTLTQGFSIGKRSGANNTVNDRLRIQLNSNNAGGNIYTNLRRILIYLSTAGSGGSKVTVSYRTIGDYRNNVNNWVETGTYDVSGWSGWNSIPFGGAFGGSNDQTYQIAQIRLTFSVTSVSSTYGNLNVSAIRGIGFPLWSSPSTMATTGHLYYYDINQNAEFPADVAAVSFTENGTSLANKYLGKLAKAADADKLDGKDSTEFVYYSGAPTAVPSGETITNPGGSNVFSIRTRTTSGHDIGILYMSDDNAYICNSADNVYNFAVFDTDRTVDFSNADNAEFAVLGTGLGCKINGNTVIHAGNISSYASKVEIVDLR